MVLVNIRFYEISTTILGEIAVQDDHDVNTRHNITPVTNRSVMEYVRLLAQK